MKELRDMFSDAEVDRINEALDTACLECPIDDPQRGQDLEDENVEAMLDQIEDAARLLDPDSAEGAMLAATATLIRTRVAT